MAQVRFDEVDFSNNGSNNGGNNYAVKFFSLKNDNEEAIVRIMHDSVDDFDILTTHEVRENGKYRGRVNCLRDPREDISKCPLCSANIPIAQRMYIRLIHYVQDANGNIVPQAEVWERSVSYANQIKSYIDNYGPMSDVICKIIRHGKPGDQNTRYEIVPNLNKMVYRDDIYVKDTNLFKDYHAFGTVVQDRSYEDLTTYLQTGVMPQKSTPRETVVNTIPNPTPVPAYTQNQVMTPPSTVNNIPSTPGYSQMGFGVNVQETGLPRPNRSYY